MLFVADVGNTQTQIGLFNQGNLERDWRLATNAASTADEIALTVEGMLKQDGVSFEDITAFAFASVVPRLSEAYKELADYMPNCQSRLEANAGCAASLIGFNYSNTREIGADRIANAVAAKEIYGAPVIVVDFGTATNIDVVNADAEYVGGALAPGVEISAEALFARAARLANTELEAPSRALANNTADAMRSGIVFGEADRVDGLVRRIFAELGYVTPVIATGGIAPLIAPHSTYISEVEPYLTLKGLSLIVESKYHLKHASVPQVGFEYPDIPHVPMAEREEDEEEALESLGSLDDSGRFETYKGF